MGERRRVRLSNYKFYESKIRKIISTQYTMYLDNKIQYPRG